MADYLGCRPCVASDRSEKRKNSYDFRITGYAGKGAL
jgi:hypothetical protein